jgi:hypothetical protein
MPVPKRTSDGSLWSCAFRYCLPEALWRCLSVICLFKCRFKDTRKSIRTCIWETTRVKWHNLCRLWTDTFLSRGGGLCSHRSASFWALQ